MEIKLLGIIFCVGLLMYLIISEFYTKKTKDFEFIRIIFKDCLITAKVINRTKDAVYFAFDFDCERYIYYYENDRFYQLEGPSTDGKIRFENV
jgi:hypothetical protein